MRLFIQGSWARNWALCFGLMALGLSACGGGSSGGQVPVAVEVPDSVIDQPIEQTKLFVGLTDAVGDFLQYQVEVVSISLERANGTVVETLPLATEFDFAQYTDVTEFFTAASVPVGEYVGAVLSLDYSQSTILVEDSNGDSIAVLVVDSDGVPVQQVDLALSFSDRDGFRIVPGVPAHMTLDFDLESSHKVDLLAIPAVAELDGVLIADTLLDEPESRRARGLFESADVGMNNFDLQIRPFYRATGRFGSLKVGVSEATHYEIDGVMYDGVEGLSVLALMPVDTPVVTLGELAFNPRQYTAKLVFAGSSVPFGDKDVAMGTVIARVDNQLTLRAAVLVTTDYSVIRRETLTVLIDDSTLVTQVANSLMQLEAGDISVGQRVNVSGDLQGASVQSGSQSDSQVEPTTAQLDATQGHLRVMFSDIYGQAVNASPLTLDVASINKFDVSRFDFSGATPDIDPANYSIDSSVLPLPMLNIGDVIRARGFVSPFGSAHENFLAQSLSDVSTLPGTTRVTWPPNNPPSLLSAGEAQVVLSIEQATQAVHQYVGNIAVVIDTHQAPWTLAARGDGRGVFLIVGDDSRQTFTRFDEFSAALLERVNGGGKVQVVHSRNQFEVDVIKSTIYQLSVFLKD